MNVITLENIFKLYNIPNNIYGVKRSLRDLFSNSFRSKATEQNNFYALQDICLKINQGEKVAFIGSNGAGKSTLLKVISRIVYPTLGKIKINGRVGCLLEVGTGFHPELSGRENIFLNASILGMKKSDIKNRFSEIVEFAGVEKFINMPVKKYSSGMYVRLAFSVAAHLEPEILIVDEVLAVGDAAFQKKCLGKMNDVSKQGRTVIFVSHNMHAVQNLCERGVLLDKGKLVFDGKIEDSVSEYLNSREKISKTKTFSKNEQDECCLVSCSFDKKVNENSSYYVGELIELDVIIFLANNIDDFVVAFGINSVSGFPINTTWSKPEFLKNGYYKINFKVDSFILASGNYTICIGASSGGRNLFYEPDAAHFEIENMIVEDFQFKSVKNINSNSGTILNQNQIIIYKQ